MVNGNLVECGGILVVVKKSKSIINGKYVLGTDFQISVWKQIAEIPAGQTNTYSKIAKSIGKPKSFRAVANACGQNPFPIDIPCHRVIRSDGGLGGYSGKGGTETKLSLLENEKLLLKTN